MNPPPLLPEPIPSPEKTLHRLFLTLFLRGRSSRGLNKIDAPKSVGQKLGWTLLIYALFGCMALIFSNQPVFMLTVYIQSMTFAFLGMFVAASAGEILFNKEEEDILLHRPVEPRMLLWAKIRVLVEVSLWMAGAFNLMCLVVGTISPQGSWRFPLVHIVSTMMVALLCTGSVVLMYQLCLRWFGRERLEGVITTSQVIISVGAVLCGQILPRLVVRFGVHNVSETSWWIALLPPAWFAGFDDALAGSGMERSWIFAGVAVGITTLVVWLAFWRLAQTYLSGQQSFHTLALPTEKNAGRRRWLSTAVQWPPLSWFLRDPVSRSAFLLLAAYMVRDRDVKLRLYPGLAPMLVFPFIFIFQNIGSRGNFGIAIAGACLGLIPLVGLNLLQFSQQWQAADVFRVAPLTGPARINQGARQAVLLFLTFPLLLVLGAFTLFLRHDLSQLTMLLPGMVVLPVYALLPARMGKALPLSMPTEAAKSASRGLWMIPVMLVSAALAGAAIWANSEGVFWWFMLAEVVIATVVYLVMRESLAKLRWESAE